MPEEIPAAVSEIVDRRYQSELLKEFRSNGSTYFLITQHDEESGGEVLAVVADGGAQIISIDTTVFPLDEITLPVAVVDAFAPLTLDGPILEENFDLDQALPPNLTQEQLNDRVYRAAAAADGTLHTDVSGTNHGRLACAWAVNEVVQRALGKPIGGGLSTAEVYKILRRSHQPVTASEISAGTIIISPTEGKVHGHIGIVGARPAGTNPDDCAIYSNRSSAALFGHKYTVRTWKEHYHDNLNLKVLYYNLNPNAFTPSVAADILAARTLPGVNRVVDLYAGDAPHPDFAAVRNSGVIAFIFKATDPLYRFHKDLYMQRRRDAKNAGLLWGSYHFGRAGDGVEQAETYLEAIQPEDDEIVCLDFELPRKRPDTVMALQQAIRFTQRAQTLLGKPPFLYGGNYLRERLHGATASPLTVCPLWFADYRANPQPEFPPLWRSWTIWQWAGDVLEHQPHGVPSLNKVDRDTFNGSEADLRRMWRCRP